MRIYEESFFTGLATFAAVLAGIALLDYLVSSGLWTLFAAAVIPVGLLVVGCHHLHGRRIEVDPEGREITISSVSLLKSPRKLESRPLSEIADVRIDRGAEVDWYVLEFRDGTKHLLRADSPRRQAFRKLLLQKQ